MVILAKKNWNIDLDMEKVEFEAQNDTRRACLGDCNVRAEKIFLNWGYMCDYDTRSKSYACFITRYRSNYT